MKISVALCAYNGSCYLREQLDSIAAQTRLPDELVICDDHSCDETPKILEAFAARAPFPVRVYVNERNLGSTANFGRAIELCTGDVIALSDQDDMWQEQKLARFEAEFRSRPGLGLIFSDAELVDENGLPLGHRLWQHTLTRRRRRSIDAGKAFEVLARGNSVTGATMAFLSSLRQLVLPIPESSYIIHDGWIALIGSAVAELRALDEPLIQYRQHGGQQLGIDLDARVATIRTSAAERWRYYSGEIDRLEAARERLLSVKVSDQYQVPFLSSRLELLEKLEKHYRVRADIPRRLSRRFNLILRELLTGRYHRFSKGVRSAVLDLVR